MYSLYLNNIESNRCLLFINAIYYRLFNLKVLIPPIYTFYYKVKAIFNKD